MNNAVETKVAVQVVTNAVMLVVAWLATRYGFKLDASLSATISGVAAVAVSGVLGYFAKHTPRIEEVIEQTLDLLGKNGYQPGTMGSAGVAVAPAVDAPVAPVADVPAPVVVTPPAPVVPIVEEPEEPEVPSDVPPADIDTNA